ncbi:hypothetical protein OUZ56_016678 [Daphnia magna]|uniref:Uncharacterized protein n=1 Tax=Daphnia magna TaxID=35525 RepID=A0ABR0AR85_9CRUS|nr:hypothetical protein OUZ56_016678 [Daphnia magna]
MKFKVIVFSKLKGVERKQQQKWRLVKAKSKIRSAVESFKLNIESTSPYLWEHGRRADNKEKEPPDLSIVGQERGRCIVHWPSILEKTLMNVTASNFP